MYIPGEQLWLVNASSTGTWQKNWEKPVIQVSRILIPHMYVFSCKSLFQYLTFCGTWFFTQPDILSITYQIICIYIIIYTYHWHSIFDTAYHAEQYYKCPAYNYIHGYLDVCIPGILICEWPVYLKLANISKVHRYMLVHHH